MEVFAGALLEVGLPFERQPVDDPEGPEGRANLLVRLGPQPPALMWVGHVDTVAYPDDDPRRPHVRRGVLHGLGAADMKGGCVAAVEAVAALHAAGVRLDRGLCLALVVGEEEYGDGTETLVGSVEAPLAVVGEPTGLKPCTEHFAYMECSLESRGRSAHAALPELGNNAIYAMLGWMTSILEGTRELPDGPRIAVNPREIQGGTEMFAVAERCSASLDVHMPAGVEGDIVREVVERTRRSIQVGHAGCSLDWDETLWAPGYVLDPGGDLLAPLRRAFDDVRLPFVPSPFRSHSDASLLHARGIVPLVCGPGDLEVAHTPSERVELSAVHAAAHLYAAMFHACCLD
jgi:acetylornithine deacetylase